MPELHNRIHEFQRGLAPYVQYWDERLACPGRAPGVAHTRTTSGKPNMFRSFALSQRPRRPLERLSLCDLRKRPVEWPRCGDYVYPPGNGPYHPANLILPASARSSGPTTVV